MNKTEFKLLVKIHIKLMDMIDLGHLEQEEAISINIAVNQIARALYLHEGNNLSAKILELNR
jgi:hypothetical protein